MNYFKLVALTLTLTFSSQAAADGNTANPPEEISTEKAQLSYAQHLKQDALTDLAAAGSSGYLAYLFNNLGKETDLDAKRETKELIAQNRRLSAGLSHDELRKKILTEKNRTFAINTLEKKSDKKLKKIALNHNKLTQLSRTKLVARAVLRKALPALTLVQAGLFSYFSYDKFNKAAQIEAQIEAKDLPEHPPLSDSQLEAVHFFAGGDPR